MRRPFSSLERRWTAHSVLSKHGLSTDWLEQQQLVIRDYNDTLFSKRLGFGSRELRLLYIMPSTDPNSVVEMVMAHGSLDCHPSYEALSYTGGNPYSTNPLKKLDRAENELWEEKTTVLVNDIAFPVKRNLMEALRRFRVTHSRKAIWIDSICINEADPVERTEQIKLMCEIYGEAEDVPIWLGERTNGLDTALGLVRGMIDSFTLWYDATHPLRFRDDWHRIVGIAETTPDALDQKLFWGWLRSDHCKPFFDGIDLRDLGIRTDRMAWDFLRDLLSRRWFDRVWTWQEKELAKKATVYIGDQTLPWAHLRFAMLLVMAHDLSETRATPFVVMPGREYLHVLDSLGLPRSPDLLNIMINVRHRETQLPQDKIFGVLGAAAQYQDTPSKDVEYFSRLVNYGYLTTEDLYKEFSRYWILEKRDLQALQACNPSKKKMKGIPSWAVDWTDTTPSHQLSTGIYDAAKGTEVNVKYHYHLNPNELQLTGVPIDTVSCVFHSKYIDKCEHSLHSRTMDMEHWQARLTQPLTSLYVAGMGRKDKSLLKPHWRHALEKMDWASPYQPTGQSMPEAFWRTLLQDQNPYITNVTDQRIDQDMDIASKFHRWAHRRALTRSLLPGSMRNRQIVDAGTQRWLEALEMSVAYKRLFVTQKGLIGLAPSHIEVGDIVCIFFGGKVPFSLRKRNEWYTLVEETYLHGFMDGEAVELANQGTLPKATFCIR
jgi:hypothetical protein